jgi:hypothetical protein
MTRAKNIIMFYNISARGGGALDFSPQKVTFAEVKPR